MKKLILNSLVTVLALGGAVVASADTSSSTRPRPLKEAREEIRDLRERAASSTQQRVDELKDKIRNKIEKRFGKMFDRYQATIDRERAIMAKINTRIAKIKANNVSTTTAETLVASAKLHLDEAQKDLDALKIVANNDKEIASSTTDRISKETTETMRSASKEIEKHLRDAHQALEKSVGALRGVSQLKNASSTKEKND